MKKILFAVAVIAVTISCNPKKDVVLITPPTDTTIVTPPIDTIIVPPPAEMCKAPSALEVTKSGFSFIVNSYGASHTVYYRIAIQDQWTEIALADNVNHGTLPALQPGHYNFKVSSNCNPTVFDVAYLTIDEPAPVPTLQPFSVSFDGVENEATRDLTTVLLQYADGRAITIKKVPIENRTGQAFFISGNNTAVKIRYTCEQSLENAVYTYLSDIGINWYGPGDNWLYKPATLHHLTRTGWREPTFRNRSFFGTGGMDFPFLQSYDPTNQYKKKWFDFERRNRYNVDFPQTGHAGQAFYLDNKAVLDLHPEWFNSESGKVNGRIKIEVPEAVQVYKNWVASKFSETNIFNTIGVDPEDGRGGSDDPLPPDGFDGINNWNAADKWWWLANEVAKMFPEDSKQIVISMYAYGDGPYNALAPKFPLRKNVYPVIIPYAFQTAYLPNEMVKVWSNTIDGNMGIYDYWNITQWSLGLPQFNMQSIPEKLKFWNANKIDGINQETTNAAGPMGHVFWLAGQMEWDLSKDLNTLYAQYLKDCFGAAAPAMKKMYDRWSNNYQGTAEPDFSLKDLHEATALVTANGPEWKRINDVKAYVHFMKLMAEHDGTTASRNNIFQWIYGINNLMMVQTAAFLGQNYIQPPGVLPEPLSSLPVTPTQIEKQFAKDYDSIKVNYGISPFVFNYDKVVYTGSVLPDTWLFGIYGNSEFFKSDFTGRVNILAGSEGNTSIKIFTDKNILLNDTVGRSNFDTTQLIDGDKNYYLKDLSFDVEQGKVYHITAPGRSKVKINTPGIVLLHNQGGEDYDNYRYPAKYFYVPKDATEIVYWDGGNGANDANGAGIYNPSGIRVTKQYAGALNTWKVPVAAEYRGKIWYGTFGYPTWSLKNIPNITSIQKFEYNE